MPGCLSWAALRASRRNRSTSSCGRQHAGPRDLDRHGPAQLGVDRAGTRGRTSRRRAPRGARTSPAGHGSSAETRSGCDGSAGTARPGATPSGSASSGCGSSGGPPQVRREPVGRLVERLEGTFAQRAALDVLGDPIERGAGEHAGGERPQVRPDRGNTTPSCLLSIDPDRSSPIQERWGVTGHFLGCRRPARDRMMRGRTHSATCRSDGEIRRPCPILTPGPSDGGQTSSLSTSRSLLGRAREGDATAWDRLSLLYAPLVFHWCRHRGLREADAADIVQDVFQAVATHLAALPQAGASRHVPGLAADHHGEQDPRPFPQDGATRPTRWEAPRRNTDSPSSRRRRARRSVPSAEDWDGRFFRRVLDAVHQEFEERTWQAFWRTAVEGRPPGKSGPSCR